MRSLNSVFNKNPYRLLYKSQCLKGLNMPVRKFKTDDNKKYIYYEEPKNIKNEREDFFDKKELQNLDKQEKSDSLFQKDRNDKVDESKPYDNLQTKIFDKELRQQIDNRKDFYQTMDTKYLKDGKQGKINENDKQQ
jgi:hypothetical protein